MKAENRQLGLKIGLIIFALLIGGLWLANLKNVFATREQTPDSTWQAITRDLDAAFKSNEEKATAAEATEKKIFVNNLIVKANNANAVAEGAVPSTTPTSSPSIKDELEQILTPSSTTSSCPRYVNCMPTIGEARPCVIPPGCEGITEKVY